MRRLSSNSSSQLVSDNEGVVDVGTVRAVAHEIGEKNI
jgi:hypothetical protein